MTKKYLAYQSEKKYLGYHSEKNVVVLYDFYIYDYLCWENFPPMSLEGNLTFIIITNNITFRLLKPKISFKLINLMR